LKKKSTLNKLYGHIDKNELVNLTHHLVSIPSVNPPGKENEVAELIVNELKKMGLNPERLLVYPGRPDVVASLGSGQEPTLILNGHMDVVPPGEGWSFSPFKPLIKDGKIFGRGSADMKGGLAAMLEALKCLVMEEDKLRGSIVFQGVVDEEVTGHGTEHLIESGFKGNYAIVGEPTDLYPCIAQRGSATFEVLTKGIAAHASQPEKGINAIMSMKKIIDSIEKYSLKLKERRHPLLNTALINVGLIQGGVKSNIIPDKCLMQVDRRMVPNENPNEVIEEFKSLVKKIEDKNPDVKPEIKVINAVGPFETAEDSPIVKAAVEAVENVEGKLKKPAGFMATCDGYFFSRVGTQTVILGPGSLNQAHKPDEYVEVEQLLKAVKIYLSVAVNLLL